MYQVTLVCHGVPVSAGPEAACEITKEFAEHRPWHGKIRCDWDGRRLILRVENDFYPDGRATLDEFGDAISACVANPGEFKTAIESVQKAP